MEKLDKLVEAKKIVYYDERESTECCILYASIAKIGVVRLTPGPAGSDELPYDWQARVQEALELVDFSCGDAVVTCDGETLQLHKDYVSNRCFDTVCKTAVYAIFDDIKTSCFVVKSASDNKLDDVAKIYFKAMETQRVGVYADIRDLHIDGIDVDKCESDMTIIVTRKDLPPEVEYGDMIEKVCGTISEYVPIG